MRMMRLLALVTCIAVLFGAACSGASDGAAKRSAPRPHRTTGNDPAGGKVRLTSGSFSIEVPEGFTIEERSGVYVMTDGTQSISYSRTATDVGPEDFLNQLLGQLGGDVASHGQDGSGYTAEVDRDGARELLVIRRSDGAITVTTGHVPEGGSLTLADIVSASDSATGAVTLTPPAAPEGGGTIELKQFSAPDGGAKGLVPADPSWTISSNQGTIEGSSPVGTFVFGVTIQVITPENSMGAGGISAPYTDAASSLSTVLPQLLKGVSNVQVTSTAAEGVIDSYSSSGMYSYTYDWNGQPWTGVAIVATDDPST